MVYVELLEFVIGEQADMESCPLEQIAKYTHSSYRACSLGGAVEEGSAPSAANIKCTSDENVTPPLEVVNVIRRHLSAADKAFSSWKY